MGWVLKGQKGKLRKRRTLCRKEAIEKLLYLTLNDLSKCLEELWLQGSMEVWMEGLPITRPDTLNGTLQGSLRGQMVFSELSCSLLDRTFSYLIY